MARKKKHEDHVNHEAWAIPYGDLVTLLFALFTVRRRTLHDLLSGLVVVRSRALTRGLASWNMQGGSPYA